MAGHNWLAFRVMLSVLIAVMLGETFHLANEYWIVLTILSVNVSLNIGDMLSRSWKRSLMTIVGCLLGTLLFTAATTWLPHSSLLLLTVFLVTLSVYFSLIAYAAGVLATTILIVFYFGLVKYWNLDLAALRIEATIIGVVITMTVGMLLNPWQSARKILRDYEHLFGHYKALLLDIEFDFATRVAQLQAFRDQKRSLKQDVQTLKYGFLFYHISRHALLQQFSLMEHGLNYYAKWLDQLVLIESYHPDQVQLLSNQIALFREMVQYGHYHKWRPTPKEAFTDNFMLKRCHTTFDALIATLCRLDENAATRGLAGRSKLSRPS